jgi:lipopolysaccharide transport system permease protein
MSPAVWHFMRFNPLLLLVDLARNAVLWHLPLNGRHLTYVYLLGLACCYIGHGAFRRMRPVFADVL